MQGSDGLGCISQFRVARCDRIPVMGPTALSTQLDPTWGISVQRTLKLHDQCLGLSTEYLTLCCWWAHQAERRSWTLCYSPGWRRRSDSTSRYVEGDASRKAAQCGGSILWQDGYERRL